MKVVMLISLLMTFVVITACDSTTELTSSEPDQSNLSVINNKHSPNSPAAALNITGQQKGLAAFRRATSKYHNVEEAVDDGFEQILPCMESTEGTGGIGVVYAKLDRFDTNIDLSQPEILFYEPKRNGDLKLVGGEPVVPIEQWDEIENSPPSLFGHEFHRNEEHGLYGLHMWVWKANPDGVLAFWHPNVSCEYAR